MIWVGLGITLLCVIVYSYGLRHFHEDTARSLAFNFLVFIVLFRSFSSRSEVKTILEMKPNYYHLATVLLPVLLQLGIPKVAFLKRVFNVVDLPLETNFLLLELALVPLVVVELIKISARTSKAGPS